MDPFDSNAIDPAKDYTDELVGEEKPYKDVAALARAALEKENFIKKLEAENAEMRSEVQKQKSMDEFLTELKSVKENQSGEEPPSQEHTPPADVSPQDIQTQVQEFLDQKAQEDRANRTADMIQKELLSRFGSEAPTVVKETANKLQMTTEDLKKLSLQQPQAFLALVGEPQHKDSPPSFEGAVNTAANSRTPKRNHQWYQQLKQTDPSKYFSKEMQMQMYRDAMDQRENFYE